jgi:hypothetical protein
MRHRSKKQAEKQKESALSQIDQYKALFDECEGDFAKTAAKIPYTGPAKMRKHVEMEVDAFQPGSKVEDCQ